MIKLSAIRNSFKSFELGPIDLKIPEGSFFMLMGPTGSGKTLILENIAGLAKLAEGTVDIFGRDVTHIRPGKRGVGIVYQDSALFPHLTVEENISYGTKWNKNSGLSIPEILKMLSLEQLTNRLPGTLSGGEKQRTALARALAINPSVLLLDEPMSSLDPQFRSRLRSELKALHKKTQTTFIMATHDFNDALTLGTSGAVINCGKIEQQGSISDIFFKPTTPFMASFVGMKNIFQVQYSSTKAVTSDNLEITLPSPQEAENGHIAISPESIVLSLECRKGFTSERNHVKGNITGITREGYGFIIEVLCNTTVFATLITYAALQELELKLDDSVWLSWKASSIHVF